MPSAPSASEYVEAFDGFGRKLRVPREEWRSNVLLPEIERNWDYPENLYAHVASGLRDGFEADVLPAARHLALSYPSRDEYANVLGCLLLKLGELNEAEEALARFLACNAPSGYLLANLANVYDLQGKTRLVEETLWRALELDPNQKQSLQRLLERAGKQGGERARKSVLDRACLIPGSWRPQLMLAYVALTEGRAIEALRQYETLIELHPESGEMLMIISGHLGKHGEPEELVRLLSPVYSPVRHGPLAGINLLQAYLATLDVVGGERLLHELLDLGIPVHHEKLLEYARRFDELRKVVDAPAPDGDELELNVVLLTEPLWCAALGDPAWLLPEKEASAPSIAFVSLANRTPGRPAEGVEIEDEPGRLSRAIPLALMEALSLRRNASPYYIQPVIDRIGPAVSGSDWTQEMLTNLLAHIDRATDIVVSGSVTSLADSFEISITIWSAQGMGALETMTRTTSMTALGEALASLEKDLTAFLELLPPLPRGEHTIRDERLPDDALSGYVLSLGQSMALLLARHGICPITALWGERALIGAPLDLMLSFPGHSQTPALLFLTNLWLDKLAGSNTYTEFRLPAINLLEQAPHGSTLALVAPLFYKLFDMDGEYERSKELLMRDASGPYAHWLHRI